jgi:hypothetical protein
MDAEVASVLTGATAPGTGLHEDGARKRSSWQLMAAGIEEREPDPDEVSVRAGVWENVMGVEPALTKDR